MNGRQAAVAIIIALITAPVWARVLGALGKVINIVYTTVRPEMSGQFGQAADQTHKSAQTSLELFGLVSDVQLLVLLVILLSSMAGFIYIRAMAARQSIR